jgi:hypothetical protein
MAKALVAGLRKWVSKEAVAPESEPKRSRDHVGLLLARFPVGANCSEGKALGLFTDRSSIRLFRPVGESRTQQSDNSTVKHLRR